MKCTPNWRDYTYDDNGNTLTKVDSTGTTSHVYNSNNQLTQVTKPDGDVIQFAYDGDNRRISKSINGVVTKYQYDGDLIAAETDAFDNVQASYVYDNNGVPVSVTKGGQTYNYHYNGHGDVVALTDSSGNMVTTYAYDVWGKVTAQIGVVDTPFGYAGQYGYVYDKEMGLYFLKSRYYDPEIGRFTTRDRFKGFENRPSSQNPYTYCENDPNNAIDPNGEVAFAIVIPIYWLLMGAVAIGTYVYFQNDTVQEILKTKRASIKNAPKPKGSPSWDSILYITLAEVKRRAQKGLTGYKEIYKLLTDSRFNK